MDRDSPEQGAPESAGSSDVPIDIMCPQRQTAFPVTILQWDRIKERVINIRSHENLWLSSASAFGSMCVSFAIGTASLAQQKVVAFSLTVFFYVATAIGFAGIILSLFGYKESKARRESEINTVLMLMEDIESVYPDQASAP